VLQLAVALSQQKAEALKRAGVAFAYYGQAEPTDPAARVAHMLVCEFIRGDTKTALVMARSLAEPRDLTRPDAPPQIGPAVVANLVDQVTGG
jgi:hypothetical protein